MKKSTFTGMKVMLKYLAFFCVVVLNSLVYTVSAQTFTKPNNSFGTEANRGALDSTMYFPTHSGVPSDTTFLFSQGFNGKGEKKKMAALYYDSSGHHAYIWDPALKTWHIADGGGGGSGGNPNTKIGSGWWLVDGSTNNVKTLFCAGCTIDSTSHSSALTINVTPYTADEVSVHLASNQFSIKSTYPGQSSITIVGPVTSGSWQSTPIADAYVASASFWNSKQTSVLTSAKVWIGNGSNAAAEQAISGDATLNNTGGLTLASTAVTPGSYTNANITVDAKGRVTSAANGTGSGSGTPFNDNTALIQNNSDHTRQIILDASLVATSTIRTLKSPNANGIIDLTDNTATLTNKTMSGSANTFSNIGNSSLVNSTISGVALGGNLFTLTNGYGITGSVFNGSSAQTWSADTASSSGLVSKDRFNTSVTLFNARFPGAGNPIAYVNGPALVIPYWNFIYGLTYTRTGSDSTNNLTADTSSTNGLVSKQRLAATVLAIGGGLTPGGANGSVQVNNSGVFSGFGLWDNVNSVLNLTYSQNNEIGIFVSNPNTGAAAVAKLEASNGVNSIKMGQYFSGNSYAITPVGGSFIYSNSPVATFFNDGANHEIRIGTGAAITAAQLRINQDKIKINPAVLPTGSTSDSVFTYNPADSSFRLVAQSSLGSSYTLPTATTSVLGGVKVDGTTITISGGVISGSASGVAVDATTTITSGTSSTVPNGKNIIQFNNSSNLTYTLTGPSTWHNSNNLIIELTGTGTVTLTYVNGSGHTISQAINPNGTTFNPGESLQYHLTGTIEQRIN